MAGSARRFDFEPLPDDLQDVARRARLTVRELDKLVLPQVLAIEAGSFPNAWPAENFLRLMGRADVLALVAERDGLVVGFAVTSLAEEGRIHVLNLAVQADARRTGVGSFLVGFVRTYARDLGV